MPKNGSGPSAGGSGASHDPVISGPDVIKQSSKSKGKGKAKSKKARPPTVTPAKIEAERTALLAEKQTQLAAVLDRHDDLIREKFHMESFIMMVDYNPEVAKKDDSQVFQNYKAQHDLLETAARASASPRKTRSSHAGGLLGIAGPSSSLPALGSNSSLSAPPARPSPVKSPTKTSKPKTQDPVANGQVSLNGHGKGKEKAVDLVEDESISVALARGRLAERNPPPPATRQMRKRPGAAPDPVEPVRGKVETESISVPPRKRRKVEIAVGGEAAVAVPDEPSPVTTSISAPVNGRVLRGKPPPPENAEPPPPDPTVGGKTTTTPVGRVMPHRTAAHRPQISAPPLPSRRAVVTAPSGVKRVKLLVRRPAPTNLSHPRQRPPPPKFNSSLATFLGSWVEIAGQTFPVDHETGASNEEVMRLAEREAELWERVEAMKRAGKWFGSDLFDAFRSGGADPAGSISAVGTPFGAPNASLGAPDALGPASASRPDDPWAAVVRSVVAHGRKTHAQNHSSTASGISKAKRTRGALVAAQVAAKIQAYWDGEAAKLEKGRIVEERRLRGLAKTVVKLVAGEWKKAVFHIREQERLKLEAEELKRGHEHLDAILDQSGHILETQQGDLSRGAGDAFRSRSRSSSVSATVMGWGEEDDDEDEDEDDDENKGDGEEREENEEEDPEEGNPNDNDTSMAEGEEGEDASNSGALLGDYPQTPQLATPTLPDPSTPGSEQADQRSQRSLSLIPSVQEDEHQSEGDGDDEVDVTSDMAVEDMMNEEVPPSSPIRAPASLNLTDYDVGDSEPSSARSSIPLDADSDDPAIGAPSPAPDVVSPPRKSASPEPIKSPILGAVADANIPSEDIDRLPKSPSVTPDESELPAKEDSAGPNLSLDSAPNQDAKEEEEEEDTEEEEEGTPEPEIPAYLQPYAVAPVDWDATKRVTPPLLLRGLLRPYQQSGLEWLASLHLNNLNGILADEMGLGKTIQTISLLAHLACDRGIWGPHLIIVPTSVLLNWEMEFKKFLPGFRILSYHGSTKRRRELRQGWNEKHHFNVCITSYTLASRDAVIFKRKPWYYMILDEAHMIKNFKSQRWNTLLMFRSFRRLLLTGTPLQNNLTELWALLQFLMSGSDFVNLKEFGEWFSNPLEKAIEAGSALDEDTMQRVTKLHTVLRPYLLRRLKRDVEKELPSKYEHLVLCPLSKRQRFLYDEFMSRAHTRDALQSGVYQKIANILMQLRKVCNHPDLFEVRPIVTSFAMERSAVADFEIKELLLRRRLRNDEEETINMDLLGLRFVDRQGRSLIAAQETRRLDGTTRLPYISEIPDTPPPKDTRTIAGFRAYTAYQQRAATISRWAHIGYLNRLRCNSFPIYSYETLDITQRFHRQLLPLSAVDKRTEYFDTVYRVNAAVKSYATRADEMAGVVDRFAFITPPVVALDLPRIALTGQTLPAMTPDFDNVLHRASVKLQIAFPDPSLLQYDCGKLQQLTRLLREKKAGGHRILIFTQMTKILDILEIFLNFHGYLYLRLDGATKIEDRQYITERFNADARIFCFIASSRSGGVGIKSVYSFSPFLFHI